MINSSSIGDGTVKEIYYGTFSSPDANITYTIDVGFVPDILLILPDPDNPSGNRGFYSLIDGTVTNWNKNGGAAYQATVTITSNGFTYVASNSTESTYGPDHIFVAAKH